MKQTSRYVSVRGCQKCKIQVKSAGSCCPKCGGVFYLDAYGKAYGTIISNLILMEYFIPTTKKWYNPVSWFVKGKWVLNEG